MRTEKLSYHKMADQFLKTNYENIGTENVIFNYYLLAQFAKEARKIAKSISLKEMDYQNAIVATWFRFAAVNDISMERTPTSIALLNEYFNLADYPMEERLVVEDVIISSYDNKYAENKIQKVVSDAINSRLAWTNFFESIILVKEEVNKISQTDDDELHFLEYYRDIFLKNRYYTDYANENYSIIRERNFQLLEKRINKLKSTEKKVVENLNSNSVLNNKVTEDIFKLAFRNYNHLVSVADSKASLLIRVNSIILSVIIGLVLRKVEENMYLLFPTTLLLVVCLTTIFLSILASRPQKNIFSEDKNSHTYQKFFFGSFDLIDPSFRHATWEGYYAQLHELFTSNKENVYMEVFKESFNVRKVLSKKFNYLSIAYWVFMIGLLISIIAFILSLQIHTLKVKI